MNQSLLNTLPRKHRETMESAGYRVSRWMAARAVLHARVSKKRFSGELGEFLTRWLPQEPEPVMNEEIQLCFQGLPEQIWLSDVEGSMAGSPLERAFLHLPALRAFWRQELRQEHFEALKSIVPLAWLMDAAAVPPGAVIHSLGIQSWQEWDGLNDGSHKLIGQVWVTKQSPGEKIQARYERNDKGRIVLRPVEALP